MKQFLCDCTNPDYEELNLKDVNEFSDFIAEAKEISKNKFLDECQVDTETKLMMFKFPHDFGFYKNGDVYFFTHSCIEHFFLDS